MTLKTLKELRVKASLAKIASDTGPNPDGNIVFTDDLRVEAIKWYKSNLNYEVGLSGDVVCESCKTVSVSGEDEAVQDFIKMFFNITEEDLK